MTAAGSDVAIVLLTGVSVDGERLLVMPKSWCVAEVREHAALSHATTFGEVRKDKGAAAQVLAEVDAYLERLRDDGELDEEVSDSAARRQYTSASAPFDADSFFADEDQGWRPEAGQTTESWLSSNEPELLALTAQADTGWGISYIPSAFIPPELREPVERMLVRLGYRVLHLDDLHALYLGPPILREVAGRFRAAKRPAWQRGRRTGALVRTPQ